MDSELKQYLDGQFARFATKEDLEQIENRLAERMRDIETKLLTEFHKWASPADLRAKSHALAIRAMDQELESLTERVRKLEGDKAS